MSFHIIVYQLLLLKNSIHVILCFENYVAEMSPNISQTLLQFPRRFPITQRFICSCIAAISSFILCFSSAMILGVEKKTSLSRYPHEK
jgi:hypothetical protein